MPPEALQVARLDVPVTVTLSGGPVTFSVRFALRDRAPLVPFTCTAKLPRLAPELAAKVTVLLALPFAGGVTGLGLAEQVTPAGRPAQARLTALLKPFCDVTVQVLVALPPWAAVRLDGLQAMVKSGVTEAAGVTVRQVLARPKQAFEGSRKRR